MGIRKPVKKPIEVEKPIVQANENDTCLWTKPQVLAYLKISKATLDKLVFRKDLPSMKIGALRRFDPSEVKKWLKKKSA